MGREDWYRRITWTDVDRRDFFARLARSRSNFAKAQYLRIQALCLAEAGLHREALDLADLLFREYFEKSEAAATHLMRGECLEHLGRPREALDAYRASIRAMRDFPGVQVGAQLDFAMLAAKRGYWELLDEAMGYLAAFKNDRSFFFPSEAYMYNASHAIFACHRAENDVAQEFARQALQDADTKFSGFSRHPTVGLATPIPEIQKKLKRIAKGRGQVAGRD